MAMAVDCVSPFMRRCGPQPGEMKQGFVVPMSLARRSIVSTGTCVMREAHSGVFGVPSGLLPRMQDLSSLPLGAEAGRASI